MIELTLEIPVSADALRARINALARPRRGVLHSPSNRLTYHQNDAAKPFWGHWDDERFHLRPQSQSAWVQTHLWSPQFDGEVEPSATGVRVRIRASYGLHATTVYGFVLILLALMGFGWILHSPLVACMPIGLGVALVGALRWQLRRAQAALVRRLAN